MVSTDKIHPHTATPTEDAGNPASDTFPLEALAGVAVYNRHTERANTDLERLAVEARRQTSAVDRSLAATRDSVGRDTTATSDRLRSELSEAVAVAIADIGREMMRIDKKHDARTKGVARIVANIERIGDTIRIISLNALIEASRAGEYGLGFSAVAAEVRALADSTSDSARVAAGMLNFSDLREDLRSLQASTDHALTELAASVQATADRIADILNGLGCELEAIGLNNASIDESLGAMQGCIGRTKVKSSRTADITEHVIAARGGSAPLDVTQFGLPRRNLDHDSLDEILTSGQLRVAVEPNFKGLSFRRQPNTGLVGLDIEYARAFAQFLGVEACFVECPWDQCTELLETGRTLSERPADILWSAMIPNAYFGPIAYSMPYTYLQCALVRRAGDHRIQNLSSLEGRTLGIINDPNVRNALNASGVRWEENKDERGNVLARLQSLITFTDQSRILDALASGTVDAFAVDLPIVHWASTDTDSPWYHRIEVLPGHIAPTEWYYTAAVADHPACCRLLMCVDAFLEGFKMTAQRDAIECKWQGRATPGARTYRNEHGSLKGAADLAADYQRLTGKEPSVPEKSRFWLSVQ